MENENLAQPQSTPIVQTPPMAFSPRKKIFLITFIIFLILGLAVGGIWDFTKQQARQAIKTVSPTPTPDLTAGWKTYANKQMDFSVKYPSNFYLKEENNHGTPSVIFSSQSQVEASTSKTYKPSPTSTLEIVKTMPYDRNNLENDAKQRNLPPVPLNKTTINGLEAFVTNPTVTNLNMVGESVEKSYYLRAKDGDVYIIQEYVGTADKDSGSVFGQILSTFKFL